MGTKLADNFKEPQWLEIIEKYKESSMFTYS